MKAAFHILVLLALLLTAGCKTHKAATSVEIATYAEQRNEQTDAQRADSAAWSVDFTLSVDDLVVVAVADSVVTAKGVIYKPSLTITAANTTAKAQSFSESKSETTVQHQSLSDVAATHEVETASESERTVIAEPPNNHLWLATVVTLIILAGIVAGVWICRRRKSKNN